MPRSMLWKPALKLRIEQSIEEKEIMAHRHLVLAYVITIAVQLGYAGWVGLKYRAMRKLERAFPAYPAPPR